jgi:hypothetical protein
MIWTGNKKPVSEVELKSTSLKIVGKKLQSVVNKIMERDKVKAGVAFPLVLQYTNNEDDDKDEDDGDDNDDDNEFQ